jgi:hypothetical protein
VFVPDWFLFLYFKYWYFRSLKRFWEILFDLQFVHYLFWLKLKWNARSKLFYWYHLSCLKSQSQKRFNERKYQYLKYKNKKILVDLFKQIRKKFVIFVHFTGFNIFQKPKSSPLSYFAQKTSLNFCVVLDHNTVIFQKEKGGGRYI